MKGDYIDGMPDESYLRSMERSFQLNDLGRVAFKSTMSGPGLAHENDDALFYETSGGRLTTAALQATPAIGISDDNLLLHFELHDFGSQSDIFYSASFAPDVESWPTGHSVIRQTELGSTAIANEGDPAPGTDVGVTITDYQFLGLNHNSVPSYRTTIAGPGVGSNDWALFAPDGNGGITAVARQGSQAPDHPDGFSYGRLRSVRSPIQSNRNGEVAFMAEIESSEPGTSKVLFSNAGQAYPRKIAEENAQIEGMPENTYFYNVSYPRINNTGKTTFFANLNSTEIDWIGCNSAVFLANTSAPPSLLVGGGTPIPDLPSSNYLCTPYHASFQMNDFEEYLFDGVIGGEGTDATNNRGIFKYNDDGDLNLFARTGSPALGFEDSAVYDRFWNTKLNNAGNIAFSAELLGADGEIFDAVYATDANDDLQLVIAEGMTIDVSLNPNVRDLRTVLSVFIFFEQNSLGQIGLHLTFTDSSEGIFVATIPEPTSAMLGGIALSLALVRRRRRC